MPTPLHLLQIYLTEFMAALHVRYLHLSQFQKSQTLSSTTVDQTCLKTQQTAVLNPIKQKLSN
jgi:hypothetical protein